MKTTNLNTPANGLKKPGMARPPKKKGKKEKATQKKKKTPETS